MRGFVRTFRLVEFGKRLSELSPSGQKIFWYLVDIADWKLGRVVTTQAELAERFETTIRTVERAVKELTKQNLIKHKRGIYAINPEFVWGGRSWNIPKASYYTLNAEKLPGVIDFASAAQAINGKKLEEAGRKTLREISARKLRGT
ncbi:replication/maintenance protein RepL [Photorhabdus temperata]|uniref:Plasmid replication protein RepL domain-containing protein n=1 Tax=Photorhabdus temperata J3 TaxID=1389415 RepID=U7R2C1_PHOTE|nr:replication/maintenance protein RepL [Photorhabdus temperata]ERT12771.1 hypothetical protein O185_12400 [Photorhabdus temperata J3]